MSLSTIHEVEIAGRGQWQARPNVVTVSDVAALREALEEADDHRGRIESRMTANGYTHLETVVELRNVKDRCWVVVRVSGSLPSDGLF